MNAAKTVQILGKNYLIENIKYSYTGSKVRYKKFLKYPLIIFLIVLAIYICIYCIISFKDIPYLVDNPHRIKENIDWRIEQLEYNGITGFCKLIGIPAVIAFIGLLIPRINCVFLKIDGTEKDITLYKSIHKDEVALIANEINTKIKENNFSSFPYR